MSYLLYIMEKRVFGQESGLTKKQMVLRAVGVAWPAVLESFFISLAGMIDTMMVATMGSYAVAAVGLTTQPKFIFFAPFFGLNVAVSALVARRKGEENRRSANETLFTALLMGAAVCAIVTILSLALAQPLMHIAGSNADTHDAAVTYFRVIMGGCVFNMVTIIVNAAQRGSGNTRISMTTNLASSSVNILFNYLLIGGHFGFPKWGVFGAAFATVLGASVGAGMSIFSLFRKKSYVSAPFIRRERIRPRLMTAGIVLKLSAAMLIENIAMRIGFVATALMAARLGTDAFAAHNVGMNLLSLVFSFGDGMQVAAVALSGQALGAGQKKTAREYGDICQRTGLLISFVLSVLFLLFGRLYFSLYFPGQEHILSMGVMTTRFMTVIVFAQIAQIVFGGCLRAAGDVRYTLMGSLISCTVIRTAVGYLLCNVAGLGLMGIWISILADQTSRLLFMGLRYRTGKWVDLRI